MNFSALIDGYYSYNAQHPTTRANQLRNFDVRADELTLSMAKFVLERPAEPVGFKVEGGFGRLFEIFHFAEPNGSRTLDHLVQAYVSFKPKQAKGLQLDFGKFYTSAGAEVTDTQSNYFYSRPFLYALGPYYHFGLRAQMPVTGNFAIGAQLINGWNNVEDNNTGKTVGITTAATSSKVSWFNNYYFGPEKNNDNTGFRHFYDTVLTLTPTDKVSAYVNFDYGVDLVRGGNGQVFYGVAFGSRFALSDKIAFAPRYEFYNDRDGFQTGLAQELQEVTLTGEYKFTDNLISRLEYRRDWSNQPYFAHGGSPNGVKQQDTVTLGIVAWWSN